MDGRGELIGGRYALGGLLGVGGTGSVFAAIDVGEEHPGLHVAVKLLHPHLCADAAARTAFLREAEHAARLSHPNVVRVHAAGLHDAGGVVMPWIALDLLTGPTLREHVAAHGPLAPEEAAAVAEGMLAALGAAHAEGIVHRDVSPQNLVLLDHVEGEPVRAESVRMLDFGLADVSGRSTLGSDVLLAGSGAAVGVVGNAAFMSPEQAQGRPVRAVSDLYQAGAVLYYALTGSVPFPRDDTAQTLQAHIAAPPPVPSALTPRARPFDRVVTRALAKTPAHRFRDAAEFAAAVRDAATAAPTLVPVAGERTTRTEVLPDDLAAEAIDYLAPASAEPPPPVRGNGGIAAGVIGVIVLALAGWAVATAATTAAPAVEAEPTPTTLVASVPTPTASADTAAPVEPQAAPPAPAMATVPVLHGSLVEAEAALSAAGLVLGTVTRVESADALDRVLAQNPTGGESVEPGSVVHLTTASGNNVVPQVNGMTPAGAVAALQSAGFVAVAPASTGTGVVVTASQPAAGTVLRLGVSVTLVLRDPEPTPIPTPSTTPSASPTQEASS